jgi:hypothetical protein
VLRPGSALFDTGVRRYIEFRASIMWPEPIALAEIMGGRTPIDEQHAELPASLADYRHRQPKRRGKSACCDHRSNGWP